MRKQEELKTERKTVLMTKALALDIEQEAASRGIKTNAVMNERMSHKEHDNTPPKTAQFQDFANEVVRALAKFSEKEAEYFERKANSLWTF